MFTLKNINVLVYGRNLRVNYQTMERFHTSKMVSREGELKQAKYFPPKDVLMLPQNTFKDKTAFITGGGTGLGKNMALTLSALGANVAIVARRLPVLEETAKEISALTGGAVLPIELDVRDPAAVASAFDQVEKQFGIATVIINNAAANFISPFERLSPNGWKTIMDIVLNGTSYVTMEAGKRLIKAETPGTFLSITASYTKSGSGFVVPSAAAKAGVEAMTKSLASEWGQYGIRLNCLAPGPVETEGAFSRLDPSGQFRASMHKTIPSGRFGEPFEISNLASYVLSDFASWLSGECIVLDGGSYNFCAGMFNRLTSVPKDQWEMLETMIRSRRKEEKSKL